MSCLSLPEALYYLPPPKTSPPKLFRPLFFFPPSTRQSHPQQQNILTRPRSRCSKSPPLAAATSNTVKIQSPSNFTLSTPSVLPEKVDLNFTTALYSFGSSSRLPTATIPGPDFPVFTTDSNQSTWLPSSSTSLPALPAQQQHQPHQNQNQHPDLPPQQDFVLFDTPTKHHLPNRSASHSSAIGSASRRPHPHQISAQQQQQQLHLHNQRVAQAIQASGHTSSSPAFPNRFPPQNPQFYASSAPSSTVALNKHRQRPPVPLFHQSTGNPQPTNLMMDPQGFDFEDFTAFEGGAPASAFSSPANPAFDLSSSVHSSSMGTVSPHDLLMNEPFMSAPNSTAFTNLTSPSIYNESPDFNDSLDVSPSFDGSKLDGSDTWFSLFPDAQQNQVSAPAIEQSPVSPSEELEVVDKPTQRRKSSNASSPSGRHSSVSGVGSRRRDKPLPPIIVEDPNDTTAMKRARNTLAARKSRERKAQRFEDLEEKIKKLEAERDHWKQLALASGAQ